MVDSFYTPRVLAEQLVAFSCKRNVRSVADFCVGDGELLRAAEKKWPDANYVATDMSPKALVKVRSKHPDWVVGQCNFLKEQSRRQCKALARFEGKIDYVLLNPPFSCRGGTRHNVSLDGVEYKCTTAIFASSD